MWKIILKLCSTCTLEAYKKGQYYKMKCWHERWFRKRFSGKLKWPLFSSVNFLFLLFLFPRWLLFYQKGKCYGSEILNACMSYQKKVIYGKKSVTRPPLHIALCYNSRWNGPISNFFSFWATERLFISKWGRISPESDWCLFWGHLHFSSPQKNCLSPPPPPKKLKILNTTQNFKID